MTFTVQSDWAVLVLEDMPERVHGSEKDVWLES
jgi:hypothetical protein